MQMFPYFSQEQKIETERKILASRENEKIKSGLELRGAKTKTALAEKAKQLVHDLEMKICGKK